MELERTSSHLQTLRRCLWLTLLALGLLPSTLSAAVPPPPSQATVSGGVTISGKNYVNGTFTLTTSSAGAHHFKICRSSDTTGWGGCEVVISNNIGASYTVSGSHLPSEGYRRAYYFSACDASNACTRWADNDEVYVQMDTTGPTPSGAVTTVPACKYVSSGCWQTGSFTITATPASDTGSGVNPSGYWACRSNDTSGWGGCDVTLTQNSGPSYTVSGSHLPADGFRRAYYFRARDYLGNWGLWYTPVYVRVDRYNPTVSANNASSEWFISRTVTLTAADETGGAAANSGLAEVRYRWNAAHNGSCTTGTLTSNGAVLTVPAGDNHLYLCAKDNTGRIGFWNGGPYRVIIDSAELVSADLPTTMGTGTTFQASVTMKNTGSIPWTRADGYKLGAVGDSDPFAPHRVWLPSGVSVAPGQSYTFTWTMTAPVTPGTYLTDWRMVHELVRWFGPVAASNVVVSDATPPTQDSLTVSSGAWQVDDGSTYTITAKASDTGSGVREIKALINYQGSNSANPRGNFSWRDQSLGYLWTADRVPCNGGGFASKHPSSFNPTTITLVGCSTSLVGGQRTVTFTVRPNPTFGAFGAIHDVSLWARDFDLNATVWKNFDLNFSSSRPHDHQGVLFGYAGVGDPDQLLAVDAANLPVNLAFIVYQWQTDAPYYWRNLDTAAFLSAYQNLGVKAALSIENILFEKIAMEPDEIWCVQPFRTTRFRLRSDWEQLLAEFDALHGAAIRAGGVEVLIVASEVNNTCALIDEVEAAAIKVKQRFPAIPVVMSYGGSHTPDGVQLGEIPPPRFPPILDGVGIWNYNTFDPDNPLEPRNGFFTATEGKFYNPENPMDPDTMYGDLLSKLNPGQKVYLIFDAMWNQQRGDLGWQPEDLGEVAHNYADFMAYRPEIISMIGFIWHINTGQGMDALPESAILGHQEVACRYFGLRPRNFTAACEPEP